MSEQEREAHVGWGDVTCPPLQGPATACWLRGGAGGGKLEGAEGSFVRCLCKTRVFRLGVCPGARLEVTRAVHPYPGLCWVGSCVLEGTVRGRGVG